MSAKKRPDFVRPTDSVKTHLVVYASMPPYEGGGWFRYAAADLKETVIRMTRSRNSRRVTATEEKRRARYRFVVLEETIVTTSSLAEPFDL